MPQKIILIRHGETDFNKDKIIQGQLDTFLNKKGLSQAYKIAQSLKRERPIIIFSSDLKRAHHTAWVIADFLQRPLVSTKLLRERSFGKLAGLTRDEIKGFVNFFGEEGKWSGSWLDGVFNIETDEQICKRLQVLVSGLKKYKNETVIIVTHGGTIKILLKLFKFDEDFVTNLNIKNTACLVLKKKNGQYKIIPSAV